MTVTDETVRGSAYAVELRTAAPLIRALKNALVCAGRDDTLPVLRAVQFHYDDGVLSVSSTDRFLALFEQVGTDTSDDAPRSGPWRLLLPYAACQSALTFLKTVQKAHPVTIEWEPRNEPADRGPQFEQGALRLRSYDGAAELTTLEGDGPKLHALVPKPDARTATEVTGFRRSIIQGIGKIEAEHKDPIVKLTLFGSAKCQRIDWPDEHRTLLVMSARIIEDATDWGVPNL